MCVSKGSPPAPERKESQIRSDKDKGMNEMWAFLQKHNAIFIGDPELDADLAKFLKEHKIAKQKLTKKQQEYLDMVKQQVTP